MPSERRYIIFELAEVQQAVVAYLKRRGLREPDGLLTGFPAEAPDLPEAGYRMTFRSASGLTEDVALGDAELAASLMLYCRSLRIPLQASANKQLQFVTGKLSLVLQTAAAGGQAASPDDA